MSFVISAPVKEILVKEGDVVKAGQPLMILSTLDLELAVKEAEWAVHSAQSLFDRAKDPYKKVFDDGKVVYAAGYVEKRQRWKPDCKRHKRRLIPQNTHSHKARFWRLLMAQLSI